MPIFKTKPTFILIPRGDRYSSVSPTGYHNPPHAAVADKGIICEWLFNAKVVKVHEKTVASGGTTESDNIHRAGHRTYGVLAEDHPLPANYVDSGVITIEHFNGNGTSHLWYSDDGIHIHDFVAFIKYGVWYWSPNLADDGMTVSGLTKTSFTMTLVSGSTTYTKTTTIEETFY